MALYSAAPIISGGISMVTATPGRNDPQLGQRVTFGNKDYVYIYNAGGSDIPPSWGCVPAAGASNCSATLSSALYDTVLGVCQHTTIPAASYGWVAYRGVVNVYASAAIAAGAFMTVGANGIFTTYVCGTTGKEIGKFLTVASAATGVTGTAYISV